MTSQRLVQLTRLYPLVRDLGLSIADEEIFEYGSYAQAELLRECEFLEESAELTLQPGVETYTSPGVGFISKIHRIKPPIVYKQQQGVIEHRSREWVDRDRARVASGGHKALPPKFFYTILTDPITIGFWSVPESTDTVVVRYVRRHTQADNLSSVVHPLIPDDYEKALVVGTVYNFFEHHIHKYPKEFAAIAAIYESQKNKIKMQRCAMNTAMEIPQGLRW